MEERTQKHLLVFAFVWAHRQDASRLANLPTSFVYCMIHILWIAEKKLFFKMMVYCEETQSCVQELENH